MFGVHPSLPVAVLILASFEACGSPGSSGPADVYLDGAVGVDGVEDAVVDTPPDTSVLDGLGDATSPLPDVSPEETDAPRAIPPDVANGADATLAEDAGPEPCQPVCAPGSCGEDGCGHTCPCSAEQPWCFVGTCQVDEPPSEPTLVLTPAVHDFGSVLPGLSAATALLVTNPSTAPVLIEGFSLAGDPSFKLEAAGKDWWAWVPTGITVALETPWMLAPGDELELPVRFEPDDDEAVAATLELVTDAAGDALVELRGGEPFACLASEVAEVDVGAALIADNGGEPVPVVVALQSCGTLPVTVDAVTLSSQTEAGEPAAAGMEPYLLSTPADLPVILEPGEPLDVELSWLPGAEGLSEALLSIEHTAGTLELALSGVGVPQPCGVPQITFEELSPVDPFTIVHFDGTKSVSPGGAVSEFDWVLQQPAGATATLHPSSTAPKGTAQLDVIGSYRFVLDTTDTNGVAACGAALAVMETVPPTTLWIELVWDTPADDDPTDQGPGAGADLDLHLAHPAAEGQDIDGDGTPDGWFDPQWDCSWLSPNPDWGDFPPPTVDDPRLERSDPDGFGPEAISMDLLEVVDYRIGVHYWADYGYGPSVATVRVYDLGFLLWESDPIELIAGDFWEVARLSWLGWPDAELLPTTAPDGGPLITPGVEP